MNNDVICIDLQQSESKKPTLFNQQTMTVSSLPLPSSNPYLILPEDIQENLDKLLNKPDFKVLDESRLTRYQREFKELQVI